MPRNVTPKTGQIGKFWITQRPNSTMWCRTWFDPTSRQTRRASLGTKDIQEATQRLAEYVVNHHDLKKEAPEQVYLETLLTRYYEQHGKNLASSEAQRIALGYWSDFFAGEVVSALTIHRQEEFVAWLNGKGHADGYISRTLSVGRAALNRAYKRQELASVPYIIVVPKGEARERTLSTIEAAALFDATGEDHLLVYLILAFNTLARPGAILELELQQFDFENRLINLNKPGRQQTKKGGQPSQLLTPCWAGDTI